MSANIQMFITVMKRENRTRTIAEQLLIILAFRLREIKPDQQLSQVLILQLIIALSIKRRIRIF